MKIALNRRQLVILMLGFSSGLPAALTASTLQAWFTQAGFHLQTIGAVTLLVMPYSFRFLWAPLFDYVKLPGLDRRRGWLFLTQIGLVVTISAMAFCTPTQIFTMAGWTVPWLMVLGLVTAIFSSSQDAVINAYQVEILSQEERALGAAVYVTGWRIGLIISGAFSLILAGFIGWKETYLIMAGLMGIGIIATYIAKEPAVMTRVRTTVVKALIVPIYDFFHRFGMKTTLLLFMLIVTYKASDALALALNTTFLMREIGFDLATIGLVNKTVSLVSVLLGGLAAGVLMTRLSLYWALIIFGLVQGLANLGYALMAFFGKSLSLLVITAFIENFCSGMGTIALVALLMSLCNTQYTATQFALLSGITFFARTLVGPIAASMVDSMGWLLFFVACFLVSLPGLFFVYANRQVIQPQ